MSIKSIDVIQFLSIFLVFSASAVIFNTTSDSFTRFLIILVDCVLYVLWGCWHHYTRDRLDKIIVFEYSLVSIIIALLAALGLGVIRFF